MEIVIYQRQRVDYGEQSDTTCLVPKFACCVAGPSEFFIQRFSIERSRTASPVAVLQRATVSPDRIRSGAQPDGYSRLTSDYGLWTTEPGAEVQWFSPTPIHVCCKTINIPWHKIFNFECSYGRIMFERNILILSHIFTWHIPDNQEFVFEFTIPSDTLLS